MKIMLATAILGLGLLSVPGSVQAQYYGGQGYGGQGYGGPGYGDRGPRYRGDEDDDGPRYRRGGYAFDEREYLRCNPDVRRAVRSGQMKSGAAHYRAYGRREGRRLSC